MKFITVPHLPEYKVSLFLIDKKAARYANRLKYSVLSYELSNLAEPVRTHPDMTFCPLGGKDIAVEKNSYCYYKEQLQKYGFNIIKGKNNLSDKYPNDISFNCVILNGCLFHKLGYTDPSILEYASEHNLKLINVNQGYTKCSTLIVDENSVITSDKGLYKAYSKEGIEVLLISSDKVKLKGYDNGFIGGAGGRISEKEIAFFGNIENHPDYNIINDFLNKRNLKPKILSSDELYDYGSIIPLMT